MNDFMIELDLIQKALEYGINKNENNPFHKQSDRELCEYVFKQSEALMIDIANYLTHDKLAVHNNKKVLLKDIWSKFDHLKGSAKYYIHYSQKDFRTLMNIFEEIKNLFNQYSVCGAFYIFRHCKKPSNNTLRLMPGLNIDPPSVRQQAIRVAEEIYEEIMLSPKKVRLIIRHSELDRNKTFAGIVFCRAMHANDDNKQKIIVERPELDMDLRNGYWSDEAVDEAMPIAEKTGMGKFFVDWYNQSGVAVGLKCQPKPEDVKAGVMRFINTFKDKIYDKDYYTIVMGFSHSFVIDTLLINLIPELNHDQYELINVATFCKIELNEFYYQGKWRKLN